MEQIITRPIISSILDNDLYKFSMMNFALNLFPETIVTYKFKNRGEQRFSQKFIIELQKQINYLADLKLTNEEYIYLKTNFSYLTPGYIEYLKNFRYNPLNISIKLTEDNNLELNINKAKWTDIILFEVPLMSIISELYFKMIDTNWNYDEQEEKAYKKIKKMYENDCLFAEFGTRRRRSKKTQDIINGVFSKWTKEMKAESCFVGSSNVFFAMKYNVKAIGTYAHEIPQAMQALESISHCNYYAMQNWIKLFKTELGISLTDTITTDMFLNNFNARFSKLFNGVRHDSGCPFLFTDKIIAHYQKIRINPLSKTIVFSDGLNIDTAIEIRKYCESKIKCSFGIGTDLSNSFKGSPALNMVIKLWDVNGFPVVKLSDIKGKENGRQDAIEVVKWIVKNQLKV